MLEGNGPGMDRPTRIRLLIFEVCFILLDLTSGDITNSSSTPSGNFKLGLLGMGARPFGPPFKLPELGSALPLALDDVNNDSTILPNHTLSFVIADSGCDPRLSVGYLVTMVQEEDVDGIIGPMCAEACESLSYLASHWNIPVISYSCWSEALSNKRTFDTFARTVSVYSILAEVFDNILKELQWEHVGLIHDIGAGYQELAAKATAEHLPDRNVTIGAVATYDVPELGLDGSCFYEHLTAVAEKSRGLFFMSLQKNPST